MSDERTAQAAKALARHHLKVGEGPVLDSFFHDAAEAVLAAVDEWDRRPCPEVDAVVGPLTRLLSAREDAIDKVVQCVEDYDAYRIDEMYVSVAARRLAEAHRAVKGDQ